MVIGFETAGVVKVGGAFVKRKRTQRVCKRIYDASNSCEERLPLKTINDLQVHSDGWEAYKWHAKGSRPARRQSLLHGYERLPSGSLRVKAYSLLSEVKPL